MKLAKQIQVAACGLILAAALGISQAASARDVHLAVTGDDRNDGSSEKKAVATLGAAVNLAAARGASTGEDMTIVVGPGIYRDQTLALTDEMIRSKLTITGTSKIATDFPAFYGNGSATWLRYRGSAGRATGLTIRNLRIVDYGTAISLNGDRDDPNASNKGTVISGNVFARIGSSSGTGVSTAAVRLVNSHENIIEGNYFHTIRNYPATKCAGLHSIYVAHYSSDNKIDRNRFDDFCGSAIKLRDRSNNNEINGNFFTTSDPVPGIQEWFCNLSNNTECTKKIGECPSTGNIARGNTFVGILERRQIYIGGTLKPLPWCSAADFSKPRISDY